MPFSKKLKKANIIAEKQLKMTIKDDKELTFKQYNTSNPICNQESNFYEFTDVNKFWNLSFKSKCLSEFSHHLKKFQKHKVKQKRKLWKEEKLLYYMQLLNYTTIWQIDLDGCNKISANKKELSIVLIICRWMAMTIHQNFKK